jgi:hypothetical protein
MDRRQFVATSSLAIMATVLEEWPVAGFQAQPTPQLPPLQPKFEDLRRGV